MTCYVKAGPAGPTFLCGDLGPHCSQCGWVGDNLCDYPVGEGKTCDAALCDDHAREIGPNLHYCPAHHAMWESFRSGGGVERELANVLPFRSAAAKEPQQ